MAMVISIAMVVGNTVRANTALNKLHTLIAVVSIAFMAIESTADSSSIRTVALNSKEFEVALVILPWFRSICAPDIFTAVGRVKKEVSISLTN